jgi:hypothetical protein
VQAQQSEANQTSQRRIPILYVPLRSFGCPGDLFPSAEYNNLLHFVHKLLHPACRRQESLQIVHKLFADCCTSKKNGI